MAERGWHPAAHARSPAQCDQMRVADREMARAGWVDLGAPGCREVNTLPLDPEINQIAQAAAAVPSAEITRWPSSRAGLGNTTRSPWS
jgi:hypothetical protein